MLLTLLIKMKKINCRKIQLQRFCFFLALFASCNIAVAQNHFKVVPLGVYGGSDESNLSAYLLSVSGTDDFVCLDAGTLHDGIEKAIEEKSIAGTTSEVLRKDIKGYLISHPHLDHIAGLVINSPADTTKNIYALPFCLKTIEDKYFSWESWANFGDAGEAPQLKQYHYISLSEGSETVLQNTNMTVRPFLLSHAAPHESTAFLLRHDSDFVLYLGDTGADTIEKSNKLQLLWNHIAPLADQQKLKGIFIEVSFPDEQPTNKLFGHLTPGLFFREMKVLAGVSSLSALQKLPLIITHIKPDGGNVTLIRKELKSGNSMQLNIIFPQQGRVIKL
jgi:3',5'-cyclic-nucleotide phosphodiesterase